MARVSAFNIVEEHVVLQAERIVTVANESHEEKMRSLGFVPQEMVDPCTNEKYMGWANTHEMGYPGETSEGISRGEDQYAGWNDCV